MRPRQHAALDAALRRYLEVGGFPEAQTIERRDRLALLKGYVDIMVLRDVIERHVVSNTQALRWLQRHLLATPGGGFRRMVNPRKAYPVDRLGDPPLLVQVSLDTEADTTWEREVRSQEAAARAHPGASAVLLTLDTLPPRRELPAPVRWMSAAQWLLELNNASTDS